MSAPTRAPTEAAQHPLDESYPADGGCACRAVRFRVASRPLFVHCCHCRWCQRESGSAFALNAMIESARLQVMAGEADIDRVHTPSESGKGQVIARCRHCHVALWSHYAGSGELVSFVRVGTLDTPELMPPDIHIFAASKQPWVQLSGEVPVMPEYYRRSAHWPADSLARLNALRAPATAAPSPAAPTPAARTPAAPPA